MTKRRKHDSSGAGAAADFNADVLISNAAKSTSARPTTSTVKKKVSGTMRAIPDRTDASQEESEGALATADTQSVKARAAAKVKESQALREELKQMALVLDLTPKRRPRAAKPVVVAYKAPLTIRQIAQRLAPVVVAVGIFTGMASVRTPPPPVLPEALMGAWVTSNAAYAGSELGFVDSEINLRLGKNAELLRYPITTMTSRARGDSSALTLTYTTESGPVELNLLLVEGLHPRIVFERPSGLIWEHPRAMGSMR